MPVDTREEARIAGWKSRPTRLSTEGIRREWSQKIKDESMFGARITMKSYLDALKKRLVEVVGGTLTPQQAEARLKETLRDLGYSPEKGFGDGAVPAARPGDIRDLSSSRRIQLIIDTNVKRARSMGQVAASQNPVVLMAIPAWKLTRTGARKKPRGDWKRRWAAAGAACGWEGAAKNVMAALKTSPIWQKLADGEGGFTDTIGSPFPPFAFGSGMAWVGVGRSEWKRLCASEGIPDGLDEVDDEARSLGAGGGGEPSRPQTVDITLPDLGDKPKGVENPLMEPPKPVARVVAPSPMAYRPDYGRRDAANAAVEEALDAIGAYRKEMKRWREADLAAGAENVEEMYRASRELRSLEGRVVNYGGSISTTPQPRSRSEQMAYDMEMDRIARAAKATARAAKRIRDRVRAEV